MCQETPTDALRRSAKDADAFATFYDHHAKRLLAFLARRVYDPEVAADLTAETFARAFLGRARFRGSTEGEAATWLYQIGKRELARYFRKGAVQSRAQVHLSIELSRLDDSQLKGIERIAELAEMRSDLSEALERLSQGYRDALQLRIVEERPYSDVAEQLGVTEHAARARVSRGLRTLATALNRDPPLKERRI